MERMENTEDFLENKYKGMSQEHLLEELRRETKKRQDLLDDIKRFRENAELYDRDQSAKTSLDAEAIQKKKAELEETVGIIKCLCTLLDYDENRFLTKEEVNRDEEKQKQAERH